MPFCFPLVDMYSMGLLLATVGDLRNPHTGSDRGPDRQIGQHRLIQLAGSQQAGDHLWSSVLHRTTPYSTDAQTYFVCKYRLQGTVFFFFFSDFACDLLGSH